MKLCSGKNAMFDVSEETRHETIQCDKSFSCLKNDGKDLCKVRLGGNGPAHFVKCPEDNHCSYRLSYGGAYLCICPVRNEIYNKYKV